MPNMTQNHHAPTVGLNEHLDYFNENIVQTGDFDDIFGKDFDLVFDPELLSNNHTHDAVPQAMAPQSYSHHHHHPQQYDPIPVQSRSFVPPQSAQQIYQPIQYTSNPTYVSAPAMVTPSAPPKPIAQIKSSASSSTKTAPPQSQHISKTAPATVSPVSVTAVFDSIPQAPAATVAKSSPRKRSYAATTVTEKPAPVTSSAPIDESNLSFEEQENLRRERNRHHAKRSRQRKRNYMNQLEEAVNDMRKENERLFDLLGMDSKRAKADMAAEEERKSERATERFIAGLKQPRNRVLDNTTLAFLRELWK